MTLVQLVSMLIGVVIPLINGLVTKYGASKARVYLQIILSGVAGFGTEWIAGSSDAGYNVNAALLAWLLSLVTALAVEAKVWAPLGVSEALKSIGAR